MSLVKHLTCAACRLRFHQREACGPRKFPAGACAPRVRRTIMHSRFTSRHCAPRVMAVCHVSRPWAGHGHGSCSWESPGEEMDDDLGAGFGVRRPLRFLAHRLNLDDRQVTELARILDELKTERAQAEVDRRRTLSAFADALSGESFDSVKAQEAGSLRTQSAERVRQAVLKALGQIHALLNAEQRLQLAYLIRTGAIVV